jgi:hypothetical protein
MALQQLPDPDKTMLLAHLYLTGEDDGHLCAETRAPSSLSSLGYAYIVLNILDTAQHHAEEAGRDFPAELTFARKIMADLLDWETREDAVRQVIRIDYPSDPPPLGPNGRDT